jgi:hypothetical protein
LKVRILPFLTTFAIPSARLKSFLGGWLLVLGIKEGLVKCAKVCVKSGVILLHVCFQKSLFYQGLLFLYENMIVGLKNTAD